MKELPVFTIIRFIVLTGLLSLFFACATSTGDGRASLQEFKGDSQTSKGAEDYWAIPEPYKDMGSIDFASFLVREAKVATSPGVGFGPGGEGYVRFALIENEQRTSQAIRHIKNTLTDL